MELNDNQSRTKSKKAAYTLGNLNRTPNVENLSHFLQRLSDAFALVQLPSSVFSELPVCSGHFARLSRSSAKTDVKPSMFLISATGRPSNDPTWATREMNQVYRDAADACGRCKQLKAIHLGET